MARKTKIVTIPGVPSEARGSRDNGKTFLLTEFDALRAEKWAQRAILAIAASGITVPPEIFRMGAAAIPAFGLRALLTMSFPEAEPLLDEMLECVQIVPDPKKPTVVRSDWIEDVEEVATLLTLRSEVIELHVGFSPAAHLSTWWAAISKMIQTPDTSDTPISPTPSDLSSEVDSRP